MADFTKFRSSVGGFHRADVTDYIETLCTEHKRTEKRLQEEKDALTAQVQELETRHAAKAAALQAAQEQIAQLEASLSSTEAALEEALIMVDEQSAKQAAEAEAAQQAAKDDYAAMELEAYRRAEAAERMAQERANHLRLALNDLLDKVSARYEQTSQEIGALSEDLQTNTRRLLDSLSDLSLIFEETASQLDSMDAGAPDTAEQA